ncbi:hypothetical protein [Streptomyces sp. DSM 40750]|uniref:hypothetical protein n=1 Tax=Streptomyces sp. DSM 40750 TaxID=2801030 RepID=UPI00214C13B6|nr:hypothetical protein [Streptomyces sp. DSM 40750]UUU24721.1 hypothetical protein JIX55_33205 [Streptomyces sp. DSM 40750]
MHDSARRSWAAGLVALAFAAGATACTGDSGDGGIRDDGGARAASCTDGTYAWSGVRHRTKLTALGEPVTFAKGTDSYEAPLEPLDADTVHRPAVTGAPDGVAPARVIKALGTHLEVAEPLAGPSEEERPEVSVFGWHAGELEGAYYLWKQIGFVDADFTYTCGEAEPVRGHVHTWETVGKGFLPCATPADGAAGRAAAEKLCPAGSGAARTG